MIIGILSLILAPVHSFLGALFAVIGIVSGTGEIDRTGNRDGMICSIVGLIFSIVLFLIYNSFYKHTLSPGIDFLYDILKYMKAVVA